MSSLLNFSDRLEIPMHMLLVFFLILIFLFSVVAAVYRHYSNSSSQANQRSLNSTKSVPPVHFCTSVQKRLFTPTQANIVYSQFDPH